MGDEVFCEEVRDEVGDEVGDEDDENVGAEFEPGLEVDIGVRSKVAVGTVTVS